MDNYQATKTELKELLRQIVIPGVEARYSGTTVTFHFDGTSFDLYTDLDARFDGDGVTDAEGNEYVPVQIKVRVNYPSNGSASPSEVLHRLQIMTTIAGLAKSVEDHFADRKIYHIYRSAADKLRVDQKEMADSVTRYCLKHTKGMRVDQTKTLGDPDFDTGTYEFMVKEKKFRAKVAFQAVFLTRVA